MLFIRYDSERKGDAETLWDVNWPVGILTTAPLLQCWAWTKNTNFIIWCTEPLRLMHICVQLQIWWLKVKVKRKLSESHGSWWVSSHRLDTRMRRLSVWTSGYKTVCSYSVHVCSCAPGSVVTQSLCSVLRIVKRHKLLIRSDPRPGLLCGSTCTQNTYNKAFYKYKVKSLTATIFLKHTFKKQQHDEVWWQVPPTSNLRHAFNQHRSMVSSKDYEIEDDWFSPSNLKIKWSSSSTVEPGNRGRPVAIS